MKRIFTLVVLLSIVIMSCTSKKEQLALNLSKGKCYKQKTIGKMDISQKINGMDLNMGMNIIGDMSYTVKDIKNAIYDIDVKYDSMTMIMDLPMAKITSSSTNVDKSNIFSTMLASMVNKTFNIKMSKTGKVIEVNNIDVLFKNLFDSFPSIPVQQKAQILDQLKKAYGEKAFKGNIEMLSAIFPEKDVNLNDSWTVKTKLESGFPGELVTKYTLKKNESGYYMIHGEGKITTEDKEAYLQTNGMDMKFDIEGTMISDIKIDKKTGWTIEAKIKQDMSGKSSVKPNTQLPDGLTIPMTIKSNITVKN